MINYFNFKRFDKDYLITNDFGRYEFLSPSEMESLIHDNITDADVRSRLEKNFFVYYEPDLIFSDRVRTDMQKAKNHLFESTQLHIFVITTECNLQCVYCQAQQGDHINKGMMTKTMAEKAVNIALQSPSNNLDFEFQGGEPLLNFECIKYIVELVENSGTDKKISFNIVSNLSLLNDEMLEYIKNHNVTLACSLDGNKMIHNCNRPLRSGGGSFETVIQKIELLRKENVRLGAIQTTTRFSLDHSREIIDTYVANGFDTISLRPLTPLGRANDSWEEIGYSAEEFLEFYKKCFEYIIKINKNGYRIKESQAAIFLNKILVGISVNYMELRSPCGASLGQLAYYWDGRIFTCDEGRMLSEMGEADFCLGNTEQDDYNSLLDSRVCGSVCKASILESLPSCCKCVYMPYCGVCPVINYALEDDVFEKGPRAYKCRINEGILDILFSYLKTNDETIYTIFLDWIG